jgi:flagellar biosynthesis/type III secretory pathway protein FliH
MRSGKYEYQSEFARKYVAQGREEGRQQAREEGRQQAREEGRQQAGLQALLEVLDVRGFEIDADTRQRILACAEPSQLKVWLRRAVTVRSVHALFAPEPASKSRRRPRTRKPSSK